MVGSCLATWTPVSWPPGMSLTISQASFKASSPTPVPSIVTMMRLMCLTYRSSRTRSIGRVDSWKTYWLALFERMDCRRPRPLEPITIRSTLSSSATFRTVCLASPCRMIELTSSGLRPSFSTDEDRRFPASDQCSSESFLLCSVTTCRRFTRAALNAGRSRSMLIISPTWPLPESAIRRFLNTAKSQPVQQPMADCNVP